MKLPLFAIVLALAFGAPTCFCQVEYFPNLSLDKNPTIHNSRAARYSEKLKAFDEPSLWEISRKRENQCFRFIWLRSFSEPIAIRLEINSDNAGVLHVKVGHRPNDNSFESKIIEITPAETSKFLKKVGGAKFWNLPVEDEQVGNDGSRWIFEGASQGKYHVVDRWSPKQRSYRNVGLLLIKLADLKLNKNEIY